MPGYDQTGPAGSGPMTGRGMGRCNNNNDTQRGGRGQGRGQGRGAGAGLRNRVRGAWPTGNRTLAFEEPIRDTQVALEAEAKRLKGELEYVESLMAQNAAEKPDR